MFTDAVGNPCGFCRVMTSSLDSVRGQNRAYWRRHALLELYVCNEIPSTFDALCKEYVSSGSNCNDVRVVAERLEGDGVMYLPRGFARVVEGYEVGRLQRLLSHRIRVAVLPSSAALVHCEIEVPGRRT